MKNDSNLSVRIPREVREELLAHCKENGIKINFFVQKAVEEKLQRAIALHVDATYVQEV